MYQPWQKDPSMESIMKMIEERERGEPHGYRPGRPSDESNNWGIISVKDTNTPNRHHNQDSSSSHWRGRHEQSGRPRTEESPRRAGRDLVPVSRDLGPVSKWGIEIARSLTTQLRVNQRSSSSDDDRDSSRLHDSPGKRISTRERKRRRSRSSSRPKRDASNSRGRGRGRSGSQEYVKTRRQRTRSRSTSKGIRSNISGSRERKRVRSISREKKRYKSSSRDKKRERNSSRDRQRNRSGSRSRDRKRHRSSSRDKRDRSNSTEKSRGRNDERSTRDSDKKSESSVNNTLALDTAKAIELTPALAAAAATTDILSKFVSMMKDVKEQSQSHKTPSIDVLPEFDPIDKANAIVTWLARVEDVAKLFEWDEKEILQHALPKLKGEARFWYLARKDFIHSWPEWKKKLNEQYPCEDYGQMLETLLNRRSDKDETLEQYFCDKIVLVKRCGIRGRQAVECVLHGIQDEPVRLFAAAAQFQAPDELLMYLRTAESIRSTAVITNPPKATVTQVNTAAPKNDNNSKPQCTVCHKFGHVAERCHVAINAAKRAAIQCTVCFQYGHSSFKCVNAVHSANTKNPNNLKEYCINCGKVGHSAAKCRKPQQKPEPKPKKQKTCFFCGEIGHVRPNCPKLASTISNEQNKNANVVTSGNAGGSQQPPPTGERRCYSCGETGHYKSQCKNPTSTIATEKNKTANVINEPLCDAGGSQRPPPTGEKRCYSCGDTGHYKSRCRNPTSTIAAEKNETANAINVPLCDAGILEQPPPPGEE